MAKSDAGAAFRLATGTERATTVLGNDPPPGIENKTAAQDDQRDYTDAELLQEARDFLDKTSSEESDNRNRAAEMLRFCYKRGNQWPDKIRRMRENEDRPVLEINQMPAFVNQVLNDIRQNRPAIKVRAASDEATEEIAEIQQDLIRHIEYESNAPQCYDNGTRYAVVANVGYWRIVTEYENDQSFNQKLMITPIPNPFSVYFDSDIRTPDGSDAEACLVSEEISKEEFHRRYPDAAPVDWQSEDPALSAWIKPDSIRIADYLHKCYWKDVLYLYHDGSTVYQSDMESEPEEASYIQKREVDRCEVRWEVINGVEILEEHKWAGKYLPVIPVFGDVTNIEGETIRQGLCERGVDGQQMYNYLVTNAAEGAGLQPKAPFMVAEGQLDQREREWGQANVKNLPYLTYRRFDESGKDLGVPQRSSPDVDVSGLLQQAQMFQEGMRQAIGIADPLQDAQIQDQSGRALLAKERISSTGTYHFVDNLSRAIRLTGKVLLDLIPKIYDTQRTLALLREDGTNYKQEVNVQPPALAPVLDMSGNMVPGQPQQQQTESDLTQGQYDVVVDVGPAYATKRAEAADKIAQIAQANPETWQVAGDLFVAALDLPNNEDLVDRFKVMLPPAIQQMIADKSKNPETAAMGAQMKQMQQQMTQQIQQLTAELQKAQLETQQTKSQNYTLQTSVAGAQLEVKQAKASADTAQIKAQADVQTQIMESHDVQVHAAIDQQRMALEEKDSQVKERIATLDALVNLYSKLGPQMGQQAEQQIGADIPKMFAEMNGKIEQFMQAQQKPDPMQALGQHLQALHSAVVAPRQTKLIRGPDGMAVGAISTHPGAAQ